MTPARQAAVVIQVVDCRSTLGIMSAVFSVRPLHHDGADHVVLVVAAQNAQPWPVAHRYVSDVLHQNGNAVALGQDHIFDVVDFVALGQIVVAAIVDQADAANVDGLLAYADFPPADIDVGVAERGQNLGHGHVVGFQLMRIDLDFELLGGASPTIHRRDAGDGQQPARDDPILHRA